MAGRRSGRTWTYRPAGTSGTRAVFTTSNLAGAQSKSSSDSSSPAVIIGVVISVLVVLILLAVLAVFLWRRWKSKQTGTNKETNPTYADFNHRTDVDAEFIHGGNAPNEATEGGDSQSVPTLPPPYSEVERNPQHVFTIDGGSNGVSRDEVSKSTLDPMLKGPQLS